MNKVNKVIALLLSCVVVLGLPFSVFANDSQTGGEHEKEFVGGFDNNDQSAMNDLPDYAYFKDNGYGVFELVSTSDYYCMQQFERDFNPKEYDNVIIAKKANDFGLFHIFDDLFLLRSTEGIYLSVDKLIIRRDCPDEDFTTYSDYCIPDQVVEAIYKDLEKNDSLDTDKQFDIILYAPSIKYYKEINAGVPLRTDPEAGEVIYLYGGYYIKEYTYERSNDSYKIVAGETGDNAMGVALSLISLALAPWSGGTSYTINIISTGVTVFSAFVSLYGAVSSSTDTDKLDVWLHYRHFTKLTYVNIDNAWKYALLSYAAQTKKYWVHQYYSNNGNHMTNEPIVVQNYYSDYFENPASRAITNALADYVEVETAPDVRVKYHGLNHHLINKHLYLN